MALLDSRMICRVSPNTPSEVWESVFSTPSGFMVVNSTKHTGVSVNGKPWTSFQERSVLFFSMNSGKLRVYRKNRSKPRWQGDRTKMLPVRDDTANVKNFRSDSFEIGAQHMGFPSYKDLILKEFPLSDDLVMEYNGMIPFARTSSMTEATRLALGPHYQKGVTRVLSSGNSSHASSNAGARSRGLQWVMGLRGIVPTDWLPDFIENTVYQASWGWSLFSTRDELRSFRSSLRGASLPQLRRLFVQPLDAPIHLLLDALEMVESWDGLQFRNVRELHNYWVAERNMRERTEKSVPVTYTGKAKKFLGGEGVTIIAPESTLDLYEWSKYMENCVSSYGTKVARGDSLIYAAVEGEKMVANIELDPRTGSVVQLLGKYNNSVAPDTSQAIKDRVLTMWPKANVDRGWQ